MKNRIYATILFVFLSNLSSAQALKVVDAENGEPISFYHVFDADKKAILMGSIEGLTSLEDIKSAFSDSLYISHLGYEQGVLGLNEIQNFKGEFTFKLRPIFFELEEATAKIIDEDSLFRSFQKRLKSELSKNTWIVRAHLVETIEEIDFFEEHFALMIFTGLNERKGRNGSFDRGRSFTISQFSRRNIDLDRVSEMFSTRDLFGIIFNDVIKEIRDSKPKSIVPFQSARIQNVFQVEYRIEGSDLLFSLSEQGNLVSVKWAGNKEFNLPNTDFIHSHKAEINFYDNPDILVPVSLDVHYKNIQKGQNRRICMLGSFIPSPIGIDKSDNNKRMQRFTRSMSWNNELTEFNASDRFFQSAKATYAQKIMGSFSGIQFKNREWQDLTIEQIQSKYDGYPEILENSNKMIEYREELVDYLKSYGLTW